MSLPSGNTPADKIARVLARLRGPEITPRDGSFVAELLRVQGQAIADVGAAIRFAIAQSHPSTATPDGELLEWEQEYGIDGRALPTAERQTLLLAKYRAHGDGSLPAVTRTVETLEPDAALVLISADEVDATDPSAVYRLVILLPLAVMNDDARLARLGAVLRQQLAAHVLWVFGRGTGPDIDPFLCDRADSQCNIDLLAS